MAIRINTRRQFVKTTLARAAVLAAPQILTAAPSSANTAPANSAPSTTEGVAPVGTIDWHNHWISPRVIELLKRRTSGPRIVTDAAGKPALIAPLGPSPRPFPITSGFTDIDERLRHLDQVGVSRQVISWATTMGLDAVLTAEESKPLWSAFNEDLSELVKQHPDRLSGYAVVPTSDIAWAAAELDRAYTTLGLIGVVLPVGAFQSREGAKHLEPILAVTQKHRGILYVHSGPASPQIPGQMVLSTPPDDAPGVRYDLEWTSTYARGVVTLTQTDLLDAYPDVTVQVAMLGGATPLLGSWLQLHSLEPSAPDPVARLRRIYLDASTSRAPLLLDLAVHSLGADRILFGSDYPLAPVDRTVAAVHRSSLSAADRQQVFVQNGQKLFASTAQKTAIVKEQAS